MILLASLILLALSLLSWAWASLIDQNGIGSDPANAGQQLGADEP